MFGPPGHAYVYFCYGNHFLFNVVTEKEGVPGAVLIRALEPCEGLDLMAERRGKPSGEKGLTNGPGKLVQALGINRSHNELDLCRKPLSLRQASRGANIGITTRIGITLGSELPLRFYLQGTDYLSVKPGADRPSPGKRKQKVLKKERVRMRT
jgi:DNA-3-methyladenine glycosylase